MALADPGLWLLEELTPCVMLYHWDNDSFYIRALRRRRARSHALLRFGHLADTHPPAHGEERMWGLGSIPRLGGVLTERVV